MSSNSTFFIEDLSSEDMELLTQLLSLNAGYYINKPWLRDQTHLLATFPPSLLKPCSLIPRIVMALPFSAEKAQLCPTHKPLNAHLIHRIFVEVSAECTTNLETLDQNRYLPPHLKAFVERLHTLNSLWMSAELYRAVFLPLPEDRRFEQIGSGCEACILASVGGNHQVLSDLRASMRGRKKRGHAHAVLLEMVEAWIDWTGRSVVIRSESDVLGREIGQCRRQMQKARRQLKRNVEDAILDSDQVNVAESETLVDDQSRNSSMEEQEKEQRRWSEVKSSVLDFYAKHMSTANLAPGTEGLHEAFRNSIVFDPITGTFHRMTSAKQEFNIGKAYTESMYSRASGFQAEKQAQAYQNLVGLLEEEEDEEPRGRTRHRESRPESRMTRWSDFQ